MTKKEAIKILKEIIDEGWLISDFDKCIAIDACEMAIKALEGRKESVTEFADRCKECGREKVLDKIRAEIADLDDANYDYEGYYKAVADAVKIIDKYKAESEEEI